MLLALLLKNLESVKRFGSPAFVVLSNKEQAAKAGLARQRTPPQCVRDDFFGEISLNAALHWFLGASIQLLSTVFAGEPEVCVNRCVSIEVFGYLFPLDNEQQILTALGRSKRSLANDSDDVCVFGLDGSQPPGSLMIVKHFQLVKLFLTT
jgi:hypothetical protein